MKPNKRERKYYEYCNDMENIKNAIKDLKADIKILQYNYRQIKRRANKLKPKYSIGEILEDLIFCQILKCHIWKKRGDNDMRICQRCGRVEHAQYTGPDDIFTGWICYDD